MGIDSKNAEISQLAQTLNRLLLQKITKKTRRFRKKEQKE